MSNSKAPSPIRTADYEAIEEALLQSTRGRWFLSEYNQRNRSADTNMLLGAITKLETAVLMPQKPAENTHIRTNLIEMAEAISQTRSEIAAMRSANQEDCQFTTATEEFDAIVEATEKATSDILEAAEDVQELAWVLREKGSEDEACDRLDARATDIYTACSFQDLTGQRTNKVVKTLSFLENRVLAMIDIWGLEDIDESNRKLQDQRDDTHLLNGPARRGEGVDQAEIDQMINTNQGEDAVIEGEITPDANPDGFDAIEAASSQPPKPATSSEPVQAAAPQTLAGEVMASDYSAPPQLEIDELDETKSLVLFS
ncbi:MAG: protein phosphatase CheZ [Hyphomicrobiaceae bacterium]|nr:protein phosphatase CheZ [Hyphomicrobiaceae bacterium]